MMLKCWLHQAVLNLNHVNTSRREAELILEKITGKSRSYLFTFSDKSLSVRQLIQANTLLMRRIKGEPIAYLTGFREFWTLKLSMFFGIFIPRPDTECLVKQVLLNFSKSSILKVLDLGTGSGAIALAIASERPRWDVMGIDCSLKSVNLAQKNAILLKIKNVIFNIGNWFDGLNEYNYDIIVSNPPYIDIDDPHLLHGDVRFEDKIALVSKNKGLADLFYICRNSSRYLKKEGWLILEHGWLQGKDVRGFLNQFGFTCVTTIRDYNNNERVTYGKFSKKIQN